MTIVADHQAPATPTEPMLRCVGLCKSFGAQLVLDSVALDLFAGEVHVIAGENGAGKSTLVKILSGVHQPDAGDVSMGLQRIRPRSVQEARREGVMMIHQELSLAPSLSVIDNLFLGCELTHALGWLDRRRQRASAIETLRRVGLNIEPSVPVMSLPLAARQLVEIAKALLHRTRVLIMDEPTSALPRPDVERLFGLIDQLKSDSSRPTAIVYISHRMEEIYRLADRITVLRDGRRVLAARAADLPREALVHAMVGRDVDDRTPHESTPVGGELLRLEKLSVRGERGLAARDVSLTLHQGEIVGIAGLQGSGAGPLLHALFGDGQIVAGRTVFVHGRPTAIVSPRDAMRLGMALLTDDRKTTGLCGGLSVAGNLALPSTESLSPGGWRRLGRERVATRKAIDACGIRCRSPQQTVRTLSGGNQQKVALGKWLMRQPSILLLHDPTRGVDIGARQEIYRLIHQAAMRGAATLMTSSDLPELLAICDRILVMHRGVMTAEFDRARATPQAVMAAAMGEASITAGAAA